MDNGIMTDKEICWSYRKADNKREQITVLSELTLKSKYEIMAIITAGGQELPPKTMKGLKMRLGRLEERIKADEQEHEEIARVLAGETEGTWMKRL